MAVAAKRDNIKLLLDWIYQNYAAPGSNSGCEELEGLLKKEIKGMRREKLKEVYNGWAEENKKLPSFKSVEKQLKGMMPAL